jgi:hypothetical protein
MKILLKTAVAILLLTCVVDVIAQKSSFTTDPVFVSLNKDNPTLITITSPSGLIANDKSRGFGKVKTKKIQLEGIVQDEEGIRMLWINNFPIPVAADGSFASVVDVKEGDNQLSFRIQDQSDNMFEQTYTFIGEIADTSDAIASITDQPGKYYALLIGIDEYEDPAISDLDKPIKDAESLAEVLKTHYVFEEENVKILKNATRRNIIDALVDMRKVITPQDNLLLFYAGHGYYDEESDIGYWIPSDGRDKNTSTADWFRNSALTDEINAIKSKHTLLIADACFSGSIFKTRKAFMDASLAINKLYELPSRKAMTSGTLTEVPDRSAFIQYLLKRLESNTDKYLTSEQLFSSMRMAVINNSDVVPSYGVINKAGDEGGDFIFIRKE